MDNKKHHPGKTIVASRIFLRANEIEMTGFDSRSGSHRLEQNAPATTKTTATTMADGMGIETITQKLDAIDGVAYTEETAGNNIPIAISKRHTAKAELRAAGLMIDTEANPVGSRPALEEAMQTDSEAFHFAAHTDAVHIETGVIIIQ